MPIQAETSEDAAQHIGESTPILEESVFEPTMTSQTETSPVNRQREKI